MLRRGDFIKVGWDGMGNVRSQLAQSLAYFNGYVYLGVTHHAGHGPQDCARILRLTPGTCDWEVMFTSPLVEADERAAAQDTMRKMMRAGNMDFQTEEMVPLYRGIRNLTVFQSPTDAYPALYAGTISNWGAHVLRSEDGVNFEVVSEAGMGNDSIMSFRSLVPFKGRMFAAPTGTATDKGFDRNLRSDPTVYVSSDPARGDWQAANEPGFGDERNIAITRLAVFNDHLYASVTNPYRGFELWKTTAEGEPPFQWSRVLECGAYRNNLNEMAPTMEAFGDALYVGSGIAGLGYDPEHDVGPAAAELIRVRADDSWDLIMGTHRATPDGYKKPISGEGPGFNEQYNSVIWSMAEHNGCFYVGTHQVETWVAAFRPGLSDGGGGFHLWATEDGDNWEAVSLDGFGNRYMYGIRSFVSTPQGLYFGTANNYMKMRRRRGGRFAEQAEVEEDPNLNTGAEVWLGQP
ncbi:hypothetical protein E4634_00625 [Mangrovimicrobium sediminis]|uniref:Uncharacterized protein n=1 Tax=Mangrovimicrobium sediminis TaxID=2562682 RepID=A0A4Z0M996_9GAMM|nr:hypothetical protein [Haliea sp. SAOS-164]TGD76089.1 hypothetical protein E4634_00625 [Haliea sp. SAOS-164]